MRHAGRLGEYCVICAEILTPRLQAQLVDACIYITIKNRVDACTLTTMITTPEYFFFLNREDPREAPLNGGQNYI
jgi:hypothetical protein